MTQKYRKMHKLEDELKPCPFEHSIIFFYLDNKILNFDTKEPNL